MDQSAIMITAMMCLGMAATIGWADRADARNRPLALCLTSIGLALLVGPKQAQSVFWSLTGDSLAVIAILAGFQWGKRIGETTEGKRRVTAGILVWIGQGLVVVYWFMLIGYALIAPEQASTDASGLIKVRGLEWAIFAPILGSALFIGLVAFSIMFTVKMDRAERLRLRVLCFATPFLIGGMIIHDRFVPYSITIGLLLLVAGSVRYLIIQGQRGAFMSQFLSPEVTKLVRLEGMDQVTKQQKRVLSVVVCDLRGFTAYARVNDSREVVQLLERFYRAVGEAAAAHNGTVKDHAGDGVLILVGAPIAVDNHAEKAVYLAQELMQRGQAVLAEAGLANHPEYPVGLGVGIASGTVTVGAVRGAGQLEYVAVGNPVNLAARLCDRAADGEILADTRTHELLGAPSRIRASERPPEPLKGFAEPVAVCALEPA